MCETTATPTSVFSWKPCGSAGGFRWLQLFPWEFSLCGTKVWTSSLVLCVLLFGVLAVTLPAWCWQMNTPNPSQIQLWNVLVTLDWISPLHPKASWQGRPKCFLRETSLRLINVGSAQGNNNFKDVSASQPGSGCPNKVSWDQEAKRGGGVTVFQFIFVLKWLEVKSALRVLCKGILGTMETLTMQRWVWVFTPAPCCSSLGFLLLSQGFSSSSFSPKCERSSSQFLQSYTEPKDGNSYDSFSWVTFQNFSGFRWSFSSGNGVCR